MSFPHKEDLLVEGDHPTVVDNQSHLVTKCFASILGAGSLVDWETVVIKVSVFCKGEGESYLALSPVGVPDLCISFLSNIFVWSTTNLLHANTVAIQLTTWPVNHVVDDVLAQDWLVMARYLGRDEGVNFSRSSRLVAQLQKTVTVWKAAPFLPFNGVHPIDHLSQNVLLDQGVHHCPQLRIEHPGHNIGSVEGRLAFLQGVHNVLPAGVGGECEEQRWFSMDSHNGHRVHELLDIPPR